MRQVLGPGALGRPRGIGWRGRWDGGSGWGTHVNPWLFHFNVWQNPLQLKKKKKKSVPKNWCIQTVVLSKTLENLDSKEIKLVHPNGNQPWVFIGGTDTDDEALILWLPGMKSQLTGKGPDAGEDWRQKKRTAEDEMVRWHHWLSWREFKQTPRDGEGQESLACCNHGVAESQTWLKWQNDAHQAPEHTEGLHPRIPWGWAEPHNVFWTELLYDPLARTLKSLPNTQYLLPESFFCQ